jgi:hypothetical protein
LFFHVFFKSIIPHVQDKELAEILKEIEKKGLYNTIIKPKSGTKLSNQKEVEKYMKEQIINFLKDRCDNLKSRISESRKKGKDVKIAEITVMSLPLKIKIFNATFKKKDFDKIFQIEESVEKEIPKL